MRYFVPLRLFLFGKRNRQACSSSIVELYKHLGIFKNTREVQEALAFGSFFSALLVCSSKFPHALFISLIKFIKHEHTLISYDELGFTSRNGHISLSIIFIISFNACSLHNQCEHMQIR